MDLEYNLARGKTSRSDLYTLQGCRVAETVRESAHFLKLISRRTTHRRTFRGPKDMKFMTSGEKALHRV